MPKILSVKTKLSTLVITNQSQESKEWKTVQYLSQNLIWTDCAL